MHCIHYQHVVYAMTFEAGHDMDDPHVGVEKAWGGGVLEPGPGPRSRAGSPGLGPKTQGPCLAHVSTMLAICIHIVWRSMLSSFLVMRIFMLHQFM